MQRPRECTSPMDGASTKHLSHSLAVKVRFAYNFNERLSLWTEERWVRGTCTWRLSWHRTYRRCSKNGGRSAASVPAYGSWSIYSTAFAMRHQFAHRNLQKTSWAESTSTAKVYCVHFRSATEKPLYSRHISASRMGTRGTHHIHKTNLFLLTLIGQLGRS